MHMTHHETCQPQVCYGIRELPVAVLKIGIADVGLVALVIAPKAEGVLSVGPGDLIAELVGVADELTIREVAQAEVSVGDAERANSTFSLGQLRGGRTEVVKLRHVAALAAVRSGAHKARHKIVDETRPRNQSVSRGPVLGMNRGARGAGQEEALAAIAGGQVKAVQVKSCIELVLAAHHPVEPGNILVEVLYRGYRIRNAAIGRRLGDGEKLRQIHGDGADGTGGNYVAGKRV